MRETMRGIPCRRSRPSSSEVMDGRANPRDRGEGETITGTPGGASCLRMPQRQDYAQRAVHA
jgi:hypothetical protein